MKLMVVAVLALFLPTISLADSDFDNQPLGPWGGDILFGDPFCVEVRDVQMGTQGGAPLPPGASGNMLCINAIEKQQPIGIRINYSCGGDPNGLCQVTYGFSGSAWSLSAGFGVYINDDGSYNNPDDLWSPPIGIPPSTTFGDNTETESDCTDNHTMDVIVNPGTIVYLDDFEFECLMPVSGEQLNWGSVKSNF